MYPILNNVALHEHRTSIYLQDTHSSLLQSLPMGTLGQILPHTYTHSSDCMNVFVCVVCVCARGGDLVICGSTAISAFLKCQEPDDLMGYPSCVNKRGEHN